MNVSEELARLPQRHRAAFAASGAERLLPLYERFSQKARWGDPERLRQGLDLAWKMVAGETVSEVLLKKHADQVEEVVPDSEDFGSLLGSAAQDAAVTVIYALKSLYEKDPEMAGHVVNLLHETVEWIVTDRIESVGGNGGADLDARIDKDPLMKAEQERERKELEQLQSHKQLDPKFVDSLRRASREAGKELLDAIP
jgi:uncharacterized protein YjaG (DUF416 family)